MPPGIDPVILYVLHVSTQIPGQPAAVRTFVDGDTDKLKKFGDEMAANTSEGRIVTTMVLPAEGLPA